MIESEAWSFDQLWIVLGLVGFATTFCTGLFLLKPTTDRIAAQMERDGGMTPQTLIDVKKLLVKARSDGADRHGPHRDRRRGVHRRQPARHRRARGHGAIGGVGQPTASSLVTVVSASSITVIARSTSSSLTVSGGAMRRQFAEPAL